MSEDINVRLPNEEGEFGRYDAESEAVLKKFDAEAVLLIVVKRHAPGFSISSTDLRIVREIPKMLRSIADNVDRQLKERGHN